LYSWVAIPELEYGDDDKPIDFDGVIENMYLALKEGGFQGDMVYLAAHS
jgi:hypothetical protein